MTGAGRGGERVWRGAGRGAEVGQRRGGEQAAGSPASWRGDPVGFLRRGRGHGIRLSEPFWHSLVPGVVSATAFSTRAVPTVALELRPRFMGRVCSFALRIFFCPLFEQL